MPDPLTDEDSKRLLDVLQGISRGLVNVWRAVVCSILLATSAYAQPCTPLPEAKPIQTPPLPPAPSRVPEPPKLEPLPRAVPAPVPAPTPPPPGVAAVKPGPEPVPAPTPPPPATASPRPEWDNAQEESHITGIEAELRRLSVVVVTAIAPPIGPAAEGKLKEACEALSALMRRLHQPAVPQESEAKRGRKELESRIADVLNRAERALTETSAKRAAEARGAAAQRARAEAIKAKGWPARVTEAVLQEQVFIGMTADQVEASWGKPRSINETIHRFGRFEQWVYGDRSYLYFENGSLTSIQQSR